MITWSDIPDPRDDTCPCVARCEVTVEERTWRHIAERHVMSGIEPWDDWLSPAVAGQLRKSWLLGLSDEQWKHTLVTVAATVETDIKQCLNVPLSLLYDDYQPPALSRPSKAQETWGLVLPCGAYLVVRSRPTGGELRTCYFKGVVCREADPTQRWRRLVQHVLLTYAKLNSNGVFSPPDRLHTVVSNGNFRARIRFCTESTWTLDGTSRKPWDGMTDPWRPPPPPAPPATTLRPRRTY
jgi:hypothetical protein